LKHLSWKTILIVAVTAVSVIYILPSVKPGIWPHKKINLGLDLQGGMHLMLEVDTQKAVESALANMTQEIRTVLKKEKIRYKKIENIKDNRISVEVSGQDHIDAFSNVMKNEFPNLSLLEGQTVDGTYQATFSLPEKEIDHIGKMTAAQALETIRNRIDQFGVSEPDIRKQGDNRILIQLPGIKDTQRAKELIGKTALLEFKLVDDSHSVESAQKGDIPPGSEILYQAKADASTGRAVQTPYLIKKRTLLTGAYLTDAKVQFDSQFNEPYVSIEFDKTGAMLFEQATGENVKKRLAIVLDGKVYSAPVIQEKISGGQARITGSFTHEEARDLAIVLRAGALPAPVKILEERTVGPSLGTDSIRKGLFSMIIGTILVIVFMAVYYKRAGLIADLALVLDLLMIGAGLALFQATLTLPGMAGIILTIGMAVDGNVLVYERIREEIALGKTPLAAVDAGYERATLTILDANITTLIAAVILFQFGTGPVKGFAVTLSLGVIVSVFTVLVFCRIIFDYFLVNRKSKTLSI
jgi:preprotein translocase subunit SecD